MRQFTQLIWKDSFEVGMGKVVRVDLSKLIFKYYVVLFINPVGNEPDSMIANVKEMKEKGEFAQITFTYSRSTIEASKKGVKYVQS